MYYAGQNLGDLEEAQAYSGNPGGMGFLPLIAALAPLIPLAVSLFHKDKKPKAPRGPTKQEIALMQEIERMRQEQAETDRRNKILLIGGGVVGVVVLGIVLLRRK